MDDATTARLRYWGSLAALTALFFVMLAPGGGPVRLAGLLAAALVLAVLALEIGRRFLSGGGSDSFTPYRR